MNFVEKRKRELMAEAKAKAEKEAMQAYAKAWDAIAGCMGSELSEKVLEAACESGLKTNKERVKKVGEILHHSRFGFWPKNEPETVKPAVPVVQSAAPVSQPVAKAVTPQPKNGTEPVQSVVRAAQPAAHVARAVDQAAQSQAVAYAQIRSAGTAAAHQNGVSKP